jgi:hypothetical protein
VPAVAPDPAVAPLPALAPLPPVPLPAVPAEPPPSWCPPPVESLEPPHAASNPAHIHAVRMGVSFARNEPACEMPAPPPFALATRRPGPPPARPRAPWALSAELEKLRGW